MNTRFSLLLAASMLSCGAIDAELFTVRVEIFFIDYESTLAWLEGQGLDAMEAPPGASSQ